MTTDGRHIAPRPDNSPAEISMDCHSHSLTDVMHGVFFILLAALAIGCETDPHSIHSGSRRLNRDARL
jgi:hypothetical protein